MDRSIVRKILVGIIAFAVLLCFWEVAYHSYETLQFIVPPPSEIASSLWRHSDRFFFHSQATLKEMLGGFALAFTMAFPLAWLMAFFGPLRAFLQPLFIVIQCVPMFALAPIMVLWFGWSFVAVVVPTALMIFFPLTMNIYQGLCATPKSLLDFFYLHKATKWQTFFKLQLPWGLPYIFAGIRISIALAGIGAVAGEWAGAQHGLGILMLESRRSVDLGMMFGALACVTGMSLILYGVTVWIEKQVGRVQHCGIQFGRLMPIFLTVLFVLTGCQQKKEQSETTLILDWLPNPNHVALYVGVENGFFKEEGINLKILKLVDPGDGVPYLTSKQADLCLTYMPHSLKVISNGAEVTPIGILIEKPLNGVIYRKHEGIEKPEDLSGRTIGYCVDGYHTEFLQAMLKHRSIVPKDWLNVSFDLVGTLANKHVDMIYGAYWNIEIENLRDWGVETDYFPLSDFGVPTYYELIVLARKNGPYADLHFSTRFQRALQKSIDFAITNPNLAFEIYIKAKPDKSLKTQQWENRSWIKTIPTLAHQQQIDPLVWDEFVEWLGAHGLLKRG